MNQHWTADADAAPDARGIQFTATWREYVPIAISNALLTLVTLGVYRFWAAARQRRFLWAHTRVIDDTLEWTGTGKEMFIGFLVVTAILLPFLLFFQFLFPAMIARGHHGAAFAILMLFYAAIIFLGGVARFRALRYRLSRTWWRAFAAAAMRLAGPTAANMSGEFCSQRLRWGSSIHGLPCGCGTSAGAR